MSGRREFLRGMAAVAVTAPNAGLPAEAVQRRGTAVSEGKSRLLIAVVNHVGYRPGAAKFVMIEELPGAKSFEIVRIHVKGSKPCLAGKLVRGGADFGPYLIGDFSALHEPGVYRVRVPVENPITSDGEAAAWSYDFTVGQNAWDEPLRKLVNYLRVQACGASRLGYNSPCHTGPIERDDGGQAVPIPGGWHSAHDHLRDVPEALQGVFGLLAVASSRPDLEEELNLFNEIRWGNDYFLSIQSPKGYLRFGVYTKDYYQFESADWWDSSSYILLTKPAALLFQHNLISAQALIARLYRRTHPEYAAVCLQAARRCFEWVRKQTGGDWGAKKLSYELGTGALAGVEMFRATGEADYKDYARRLANKLVDLQSPQGFFAERHAADPREDSGYDLPIARAVYAPMAPLGLCAAARWLPDDPDHLRWKASLERFADYLRNSSEANAFGLIPYRVYRHEPSVRTRSRSGLQYRYFVETNVKMTIPFEKPAFWQTGNSAQAAGHGVILCRMADIQQEP